MNIIKTLIFATILLLFCISLPPNGCHGTKETEKSSGSIGSIRPSQRQESAGSGSILPESSIGSICPETLSSGSIRPYISIAQPTGSIRPKSSIGSIRPETSMLQATDIGSIRPIGPESASGSIRPAPVGSIRPKTSAAQPTGSIRLETSAAQPSGSIRPETSAAQPTGSIRLETSAAQPSGSIRPETSAAQPSGSIRPETSAAQPSGSIRPETSAAQPSGSIRPETSAAQPSGSIRPETASSGSIRPETSAAKPTGSIRSETSAAQPSGSIRPETSEAQPQPPGSIRPETSAAQPTGSIRPETSAAQPTDSNRPESTSIGSIHPISVGQESGTSGSIRPAPFGSIQPVSGNESADSGSIRPAPSLGKVQAGGENDDFQSSGKTTNSGSPKKILVIAPNMFGSHFALFNSIVRIIIAHKWVQKIKLFIPEYSILHQKSTDLTTGGKLIVQYFNPHEMAGGRPRPIEMDHNEWAPRDFRKSVHFRASLRIYLLGTLFFLIFLTTYKLGKKLAKRKDLMIGLREEKFDIGIAELWDHGAFPILSMLGIQNVFATQNMPLESIHYAYLGYLTKIVEKGDIPELWSAKYGDYLANGSAPIFARNFQIKVNAINKAYEENLMKPFREILKEYYGMTQMPPFSYVQLFSGIRNIFVNTQPFLDFPMPPGYPEKIVHIGGIQFPPRYPSPTMPSSSAADLQKTFDEIVREMKAIQTSRSKKGLILISFGSIVSMTKMPDPAFFHFLHAFNTHNEYEFLWKFESEKELHFNLLRKSKNVHVKKWLNQFDLLGNEQTKLFISHCGINSIIEAVHHGIPILCVPFLADQFYNAEALAKQNAAVVVNKDDLSEITAKIGEALNKRYKQRLE